MRTTLDLDDDVLAAARERARREHQTMDQVVSELVRQALMAPGAASHGRELKEPAAVYGLQPFPSRGALVTNELIDRLRNDDAC